MVALCEMIFTQNHKMQRLSSESILIQNGVAKISTFDLLTTSAHASPTTKNQDDTVYIDNTLCDHRKNSNIFSLGVILWEISSGKLPYRELTQNHKCICSGTPELYVRLYSACWDKIPEKRPSCKEVYDQLA
ncbi:2074_t:CDS:2, partial [Paraglomus occultum]